MSPRGRQQYCLEECETYMNYPHSFLDEQKAGCLLARDVPVKAAVNYRDRYSHVNSFLCRLFVTNELDGWFYDFVQSRMQDHRFQRSSGSHCCGLRRFDSSETATGCTVSICPDHVFLWKPATVSHRLTLIHHCC